MAPLDSYRGSGASPFSQASAQAAFSASLDTAPPSSSQTGAIAADKSASSPQHHVTHMPFGPAADSPFEHPEQPELLSDPHTSGQSTHGAQLMATSSSRSGVEAAGSGLNPSDAQVRNSLTAASQPLPPESTAELDAAVVDDRHMTISSGSALAEAVQSENATAWSQALQPSDPQAESAEATMAAPVAADMFSGLDVGANKQEDA